MLMGSNLTEGRKKKTVNCSTPPFAFAVHYTVTTHLPMVELTSSNELQSPWKKAAVTYRKELPQIIRVDKEATQTKYML
jgi:hypothetical protein